MKMSMLFIVSNALFTFAICTSAQGSDMGRLCLAPVPKPTLGEKTLSNPTGGNPDITYTFRLDEGDWIELGRSVTWIDDVDMKKKHLITIQGKGKPIESFFFKFNVDQPDLCLFLNTLHLTWQLWPVEETGDWCPCYANDK